MKYFPRLLRAIVCRYDDNVRSRYPRAAALQAQIVPAQVAVVGEQCRSCVSCGRRLASKGHYPVTFRSLFGDVPVRVACLSVPVRKQLR